ncbi:MAG: adenylosuccinate synthase [FCB group bacterium]|nr:adenylosuccinate synthase [FCB group bacterium]
MPATGVVGTQWGDEGKGRMTDLLAQKADAVVRFQGGANAGHTIINEHGSFALHLIPSGIFSKQTINILGSGVIVEPTEFLNELESIQKQGLELGEVVISDRAHLGLPVHRIIEAAFDKQSGAIKYGSTKRGIAQAYMCKAAKVGLQIGDLLGDESYLLERLTPLTVFANTILRGVGEPEGTAEDMLAYLKPLIPRIKPYIKNIVPIIHGLLDEEKNILLEGQLGTLRDLDWGIYPFTTSSNPLTGFASVGTTIPPSKITKVLGIMKAYSSCVGTGPFVSEISGELADKIRAEGKEFGASTGRPRRIGWFDLVASRYGARVQGATSICLTLLDVLSCMDKIQVCTHYEINGQKVDDFPGYYNLINAHPVLKEFPGWKIPIREVRKFDDLPKEARDYVRYIEDSVGVPISHISVGPNREDIIYI